MNRRTFVEKSFLASLGIVLSPALFSSCRETDLLADSTFTGKVIIVGAGVAGLYAGYLLHSRGIEFTILEAADRSGGRMGKNSTFADYPIDLGAQWLHGYNSILGDLITEKGTKVTEDNSNTVFWFQDALTSTLPKDVGEIVASDGSLPDISFWEYAQSQGLGEDYKYLVEQIAGDQGADANELSIKWNATEEEEYSSGESDFKFEETFFDLIDKHIASPIRDSIQLNTIVSQIDYSNDSIQLTDSDGNIYTGDKVLLTVPITILQDEDIEFVPALPALKVDAFNKIGMGAGMKVFLKFSNRFYDENIGGGAVCAAYADEVTGKNGSDHVLLAFVMGAQAEALGALGDDTAITNALLAELDTMYEGQATASFLASHVENWTANPFVRGAYSYSKIGIGNARSIAAESVDKKLYFGGEAMNLNGHHQTVHGAVETAYREIRNLLQP